MLYVYAAQWIKRRSVRRNSCQMFIQQAGPKKLFIYLPAIKVLVKQVGQHVGAVFSSKTRCLPANRRRAARGS